MTLLNYTDPVPTPAPLTSGSTVQTYTDPTGEVWVAKNGVNGGNWLKARDVLHARWWRSANWTVTASVQAVTLDTSNFDKYGLWVPASTAFVTPAAGLYSVYAGYAIAATAVGNFTNLMIRYGGPAGSGGQRIIQEQSTSSGTATGTYIFAYITWTAVVGDTFWMEAYSTSAGLPFTGQVGTQMTYFGIDYLG